MNNLTNNTNGNSFGVNIYWTVPQNIMVEGEVAQTAVEDAGFERDDLPMPSDRAICSRAAYSFQDRRHKLGRRITEKATDNGRYVTYGILGQTRPDSETVGFVQDTTVRFDKDTKAVTVEGALVLQVEEKMHQFRDSITDDDIRLFLRNIVRKCFGIAKRPTGGIYFIPEQYVFLVESAQRFLDALGTGAKLYIEGVVNGARERGNIWESVEFEIDTRVADTLNAVAKIEKRVSSIKTHEAKLAELTNLMDVYRGLLGEEAKFEGIAERIKEAAETVQHKLSELQSASVSRIKKVRAPKATPVASAVSVAKSVKSADFIELAFEVLSENGPMHYNDLTSEALNRGLVTSGNTPANTMNARLSMALKKSDSRFRRVGRGVYAVA